MVFAREVSDSLTSLVKKLDEAAAKNSKAGLVTFTVVCNDDEKTEDKLKELAKKEKLTKVVLTIDTNKAGPYNNFDKEADVTVMLYVKKKVKVNHTFKKGELKDKDVETVIKDLDKILS